jgi:hypothetical protein
MLQAIFYARFHPERGPSIVHQFPDHSILSPSNEPPPILAWADISAYIIPPYDVCNRPLSICTNNIRVLALPVSLEDSRYARNRFTFNIGFVVVEDEPVRPWEQVLRKTSRFLRQLEIDDGLLSIEEDLDGLKWAGEIDYPAYDIGIVHGLLHDIFDQLNDYGEACIRINDVHVLNLRLDEPEENDQNDHGSTSLTIRPWHVPLLIRDLPDPSTWTWDLTLRRIHPYINGVNHIQRISELADVEMKLIKHAVRDMMLHDRVIILDIFHYQAVYAGASGLIDFVKDVDVQDECRSYVALSSNPSKDKQNITSSPAPSPPSPTRQNVIELYSALQPGVCVADFCLAQHNGISSKTPLTSLLDIRRFITFGVIKGILRRQQKYALAVADTPAAPVAPPQSTVSSPPGLPSPTPPPQTASSRSSFKSTSSSSPSKFAATGASNLPRHSSFSTTGTGATNTSSLRRPSQHQQASELAAELDRAWKKAALSSGWATPPTLLSRAPSSTSISTKVTSATAKTSSGLSSTAGTGTTSTAATPMPILPESEAENDSNNGDEEAEAMLSDEESKLWKFLDGRHPLDQICVEMHWSEKALMEKLNGGGFGEVVIFCK